MVHPAGRHDGDDVPADQAEPDSARSHAGAHHDADALDLRWHDVLLPGWSRTVLGCEQHPVDRTATLCDAPDRQSGRRCQALTAGHRSKESRCQKCAAGFFLPLPFGDRPVTKEGAYSLVFTDGFSYFIRVV